MPTFDEVADLVASETGTDRSRVRPESRLLHDLEIYGDDAGDLLEACASRFGIDFSDFVFDRYFYHEPSLLFPGSIFRDLRGLKGSTKEPLTLAMLVAVAQSGRWSEVESRAV
jgi:hypothetical protein